MADGIRSGRVVIPATETRDVVLANLVGNKKALYRFFNSGKTGEAVEIRRNGGVVHTLPSKDSVDLSVGNESLSVTAGAMQEAEVVYELLGLV
ncbi:MAG: hypothetical protein ACF8TS_19210 [Maioricimonas sp. JB049]